jgi:hypothetical protein
MARFRNRSSYHSISACGCVRRTTVNSRGVTLCSLGGLSPQVISDGAGARSSRGPTSGFPPMAMCTPSASTALETFSGRRMAPRCALQPANKRTCDSYLTARVAPYSRGRIFGP